MNDRFKKWEHPEINESRKQFKETIEASQEVYCQKIIIYPNADGGSQDIVREIEKIERTKDKNMKIFRSFPHKDFLSLLKHSSVLVGNSSSGIIEAPSFKLPVAKTGDRIASCSTAKLDSTPYSLAVRLLIRVLFKLPDRIRSNFSGASSPL